MPSFFAELDLRELSNIRAFNKQKFNEKFIREVTIEQILTYYSKLNNQRSALFRRTLFTFILDRFPVESQAIATISHQEIQAKALLSDTVVEEDLLFILYDLAKFDIYCAMLLYSHTHVWKKITLSFEHTIDDDFQEPYEHIFLMLHLYGIAIDFDNPDAPFYFENIRLLHRTAKRDVNVHNAIIRIANICQSAMEDEFNNHKEVALAAINSEKSVRTAIGYYAKYYALKAWYWLFNAERLAELKAQHTMLRALTEIVTNTAYIPIDTQLKLQEQNINLQAINTQNAESPSKKTTLALRRLSMLDFSSIDSESKLKRNERSISPVLRSRTTPTPTNRSPQVQARFSGNSSTMSAVQEPDSDDSLSINSEEEHATLLNVPAQATCNAITDEVRIEIVDEQDKAGSLTRSKSFTL